RVLPQRRPAWMRSRRGVEPSGRSGSACVRVWQHAAMTSPRPTGTSRACTRWITPVITMLCEGDIIMVERYAGRTEAARWRAADLVVRREATGSASLRSFAAIASATIVWQDDPDAALADVRRTGR